MFNSIRNNRQTQKISVVLILLFVVSQSLALSSGCKMDRAGHDMTATETQNSTDPHAGHNMDSMNQSMALDSSNDAAMSDCCQLDCQCAQNTCSHANPIIFNSFKNELNNLNHSMVFVESYFIPSLTASTLFRPPIIC